MVLVSSPSPRSARSAGRGKAERYGEDLDVVVLAQTTATPRDQRTAVDFKTRMDVKGLNTSARSRDHHALAG